MYVSYIVRFLPLQTIIIYRARTVFKSVLAAATEEVKFSVSVEIVSAVVVVNYGKCNQKKLFLFFFVVVSMTDQ